MFSDRTRFLGQVPLALPTHLGKASFVAPPSSKGPPSESNPELAKKPYASTVDELCQLGRKQAADFAGPSYGERIIKVIRNAKENEDAVLEDLKKYCPEGFGGIFAALWELRKRRELGLLPRKPAQTGVPTSTPAVSEEDKLFTPRAQRTLPPSYPLTPTPGSPYGKTPEGNVLFAPRTQRTSPPSYPLTPTPRAALPTYLDVQSQGQGAPSYGTDLQRQIDSYRQRQEEVYGTPTPTSSMGPCPPGTFRNPNYPERGCQPLGAGGTPTLPGGFGTSDVSTGTFSAPSSPAWSMGAARRPIPVVNLRRRG